MLEGQHVTLRLLPPIKVGRFSLAPHDAAPRNAPGAFFIR